MSRRSCLLALSILVFALAGPSPADACRGHEEACSSKAAVHAFASHAGRHGDSDGVRIVVRSGDDLKDGDGLLVLASSGDGEEHQLRLSLSDGSLNISTPPDADRPWIGFLYEPKYEGLRVSGVMADSPGKRAGLKAGDLITRLNGTDLSGDVNASELFAALEPGQVVDLTVERDGKTKELRVDVGSHPGSLHLDLHDSLQSLDLGALGALDIAGDLLGGMEGLKGLEALKELPSFSFSFDSDGRSGFPFAVMPRSKPRLGVVLESLDGQLAEFFGVEAGEGLLVKEVIDGSSAADAGILAGDVLLRIDGDQVRSIHDVRSALSNAEEGESVRIEVMRRGSLETLHAEMNTPNGDASFAFPSGWSQPGDTDTAWPGKLQEAKDVKEWKRQMKKEASKARQLRNRSERSAEDYSRLLQEREEASRTF